MLIGILSLIIILAAICNFIYLHYYKIDTSKFSYTFNSRVVLSPDKRYALMVDLYKTTEDSDVTYIMGTLGSLDDHKGYTKDAKIIFWQRVDSHLIKEKQIQDVVLTSWVDVTWLEDHWIEINGITFNIHKGYDYRRD